MLTVAREYKTALRGEVRPESSKTAWNPGHAAVHGSQNGDDDGADAAYAAFRLPIGRQSAYSADNRGRITPLSGKCRINPHFPDGCMMLWRNVPYMI